MARSSNIVVGKDGQPLGNKGMDTRRSLIEAARRLMHRVSPFQITATAISKEANTAPATFYVYFNGVEDVLWALCDLVTEDTAHLFLDPAFLRRPDRLEIDALDLVKGYSAIWSKHSVILSYRNLEADRGNGRFNLLLTRTGLPIMQGLCDRILKAAPADRPIRPRDANAEAVVIVAAMDRLSAAVLLYPEQSVMPGVLHEAVARMIVRSLRYPIVEGIPSGER
ncbi:TetR/AcrR family transcriptional regulator [Sphingomonas bacterium]|uniref:TetR/AcrR family transcriptional regulator n=1 Tax=Sphingomonas bacterium TaxID=1895847 RepID=UPI001577022E|nr:TetR/AcrR family transcriptional regulator [Sphingomonas bacterium]